MSLCLDLQIEERERDWKCCWDFWNLKAHLLWHTPSNKATHWILPKQSPILIKYSYDQILWGILQANQHKLKFSNLLKVKVFLQEKYRGTILWVVMWPAWQKWKHSKDQLMPLSSVWLLLTQWAPKKWAVSQQHPPGRRGRPTQSWPLYLSAYKELCLPPSDHGYDMTVWSRFPHLDFFTIKDSNLELWIK